MSATVLTMPRLPIYGTRSSAKTRVNARRGSVQSLFPQLPAWLRFFPEGQTLSVRTQRRGAPFDRPLLQKVAACLTQSWVLQISPCHPPTLPTTILTILLLLLRPNSDGDRDEDKTGTSTTTLVKSSVSHVRSGFASGIRRRGRGKLVAVLALLHA